jgi:hypothetical protein
MVVVVVRVGVARTGGRVGELDGAEKVDGSRRAGGADADGSHDQLIVWRKDTDTRTEKRQPGPETVRILEKKTGMWKSVISTRAPRCKSFVTEVGWKHGVVKRGPPMRDAAVLITWCRRCTAVVNPPLEERTLKGLLGHV